MQSETADSTSLDPLLTREQASEYLGVSPGTLESWAVNGRYSLKFVKIGRLVRYRQSELERFVQERTVG